VSASATESLESLARRARAFAEAELADLPHDDESIAGTDHAAREALARLARGGWLELVAPAQRCAVVCVLREELARVSGLADTMFVMQGLGTGPLFLFGSGAQRADWVPRAARGDAVAAFALTEPEAGSDVGAMTTMARRDGADYVIDGQKTLISNAGLADVYCLFARTSSAGRAGLSAFVVPAATPGLVVSERFAMLAAHPIGSLRLEGCRVPASARIGEEGDGFRIAMACLDRFRPTVGAAAVGFAERALEEAVARARSRRQFDRALAELQGVQFAIADMKTELDAARLLVRRAAAAVDAGAKDATRRSAMAKLYATEAAQRVVDASLQIQGGQGLVRGRPVEQLYREVRALRIYEGTSEIQRLVIAREVLRS
jgi:alkylation response protein AidB-like acyl-CoA dehydrogenase